MYASLYYLFVDLLDVYLCVLPTIFFGKQQPAMLSAVYLLSKNKSEEACIGTYLSTPFCVSVAKFIRSFFQREKKMQHFGG